MSKCDYTEKTVYMGIDVHKKTLSCVAVCRGMKDKHARMPACPNALIAYIDNHFEGAYLKTAYEAGFSGFHLHCCLTDAGIDNIVVHPGAIAVVSRDRVKTDRRDATNIAKQLADGRLRPVFVPSEEAVAMREVSRLRRLTVGACTRVAQQFKALLFRHGLIAHTEDSTISRAWVKAKLAEAKASKDIRRGLLYSMESLANEWIHLKDKAKQIQKDAKAMQSPEERALIDIYKSAPGMGDMQRFANNKQLYSYLGLTPTENSSGERRYLGHISRQGRSILRDIFIEAAWTAVRKDERLLEIYQDIAARRGKQRAIVGMARRLAGHLRACVRKGESYNSEYAYTARAKTFELAKAKAKAEAEAQAA